MMLGVMATKKSTTKKSTMKKSTMIASGGLKTSTIIFLVLFTLKLFNVISWSWFWVVFPLWAGFAFSFLMWAMAVLIVSFTVNHRRNRF